MKPKVYLETTVVSYLTAPTSRDLLLAAHQQVTRDWWAGRDAFSLFISQFVWDEASAGASAAAERRLAVLRDIPFLDLTSEATTLAAGLLRQGGVPQNAKIDALHIAVAAVHGMDYLVSWNCTHIANPTMRGRIEAVCRAAGFNPPLVCTPLEVVKEPSP